MEKPIRVLQIVGRMERAGLETLIMNIYRNIDRSKVQFDFLCHFGEEAHYNEEIRSLGGEIYEMPKIKSMTKTYYWKVFEYIKALNSFFKKHQEFNVIHGHMTNTASLYMPLAKKHGVKTCIAHSHLTKSRQGLTGKVTTLLQLPIQKLSTDYFACSKEAGKWLFDKAAINSERFKVINNAIDSEAYEYNEKIREKYRKDLGLKNDFVIGHVGRFFYQKNHEFLVDIFNEIQKQHKNSKLLLIGRGKLENDIKEKVSKLGLEDKVLFLGVREDISKLMQAMDVFVMPSHFEGLPVVGVEAQAAGLKCIFSDKITDEADILKTNSFLDLSEGATYWSNEILKYKDGYGRKSTKKEIVDRGYDIKALAKWMEEYYINKHRG
ncbi:glycosyl transferase family 1 [Propionigenium maris DSM 9537]|uniref:Glycosyl transferase family 1 n=1 Tax=Propionigenium maris DSM 9537 TaxID=1123000 RepID=A0A9W6LNH7_9FUSO|nr:glycosyltransferase family 1 protein [Propionigenium maris]GLI56914.1 glycosyl transferase family 1 [Propionigenium maris DSM 9537]